MSKQSKKQSVYPLHDRVVIIPDKPPEKTEGGIFVPENRRQAQSTGVVLVAGPGLTTESGQLIKTTVKSDNRVVYERHQAIEITVAGETYHVVHECDIIAILT